MHQDLPESGTRLKNPDQRRQVFIYLKPLIERERLSGTPEDSV